MGLRYIVHTVRSNYGMNVYRVYDEERNRHICGAVTEQDAKDICKAMNVSNNWEPILTRHEMRECKHE